MSTETAYIRSATPSEDGKAVIEVELPVKEGDEKSQNMMFSMVVDPVQADAWLYENPDKRLSDYFALLVQQKYTNARASKTICEEALANPAITVTSNGV